MPVFMLGNSTNYTYPYGTYTPTSALKEKYNGLLYHTDFFRASKQMLQDNYDKNYFITCSLLKSSSSWTFVSLTPDVSMQTPNNTLCDINSSSPGDYGYKVTFYPRKRTFGLQAYGTSLTTYPRGLIAPVHNLYVGDKEQLLSTLYQLTSFILY